jgi:endonuclease YncB( thermonuclease family)
LEKNMKRLQNIVPFLVLVVCLSAGPASAWQGRVVRVLDGDSLLVRDTSRVHEIRLYGIDAPEYKQSFGRQAARIARKQLLHKKVNVVGVDVDRYGREVALVYRGEILVNRELVRRGAAWMYPRYCRKKNLCRTMKTVQETARQKRLGLWAGDNPLSPWKWKYLNRKQLLSGKRRQH